MWCVAELDEEYIRRMEDVLAVYEKPLSEREPVVCIDEKPVVLHADLRPPRPLQPGRTLRRDSEYERRGTANAFCGVEPKAGRHHLRVTPDRSSPEFADYLLEIAEHYPAADTIHLVMDNLSSHTRKAVVERYGEKAGGWLWGLLRCTTLPHTAAGSIRQRSKSVCSLGSVWDGDESPRWTTCGGKSELGAGE
jgi:DDE superfamily endonuclease